MEIILVASKKNILSVRKIVPESTRKIQFKKRIEYLSVIIT